jgi:hypothetical protein
MAKIQVGFGYAPTLEDEVKALRRRAAEASKEKRSALYRIRVMVTDWRTRKA